MKIIQKVTKEAKRLGFTKWTIDTYVYNIKKFLYWCNKPLIEIKKQDVTNYIDYLIERNYSPNSINVNFSAIKFMFKVNRKNWRFYQKFSRKPIKIPTVLTKKEVKKLLSIIQNKTHHLIIALMYSSGLRLSELTNLKIEHFFLDENYGIVKNGKGQKDRLFIISSKLKNSIKDQIGKRKGYLFLGKNGKISRKSVYSIVKKYGVMSKINKNIHPHTLRHSFATHIIENGYDITLLQRLLGHSKIETTNTYIHYTKSKINIISPYDSL